jgi:hypothetical protein
MHSHPNIATAYDVFFDNGLFFQLSDYVHSSRNVYNLVQNFNLNLQYRIPEEYMRFVYEYILQVSITLLHSHTSGLYHGSFDLAKVLARKIIKK